ncbi:transposase [Bacillus toyonensis]|nr:transposase [Bacillus toyonensis]
MNLSISDELELFSKELQRYMSPNALEQLGVTVHVHQLKILK